nr:hypothetical protein FVER53263_20944 [Fusarium verticillioides]
MLKYQRFGLGNEFSLKPIGVIVRSTRANVPEMAVIRESPYTDTARINAQLQQVSASQSRIVIGQHPDRSINRRNGQEAGNLNEGRRSYSGWWTNKTRLEIGLPGLGSGKEAAAGNDADSPSLCESYRGLHKTINKSIFVVAIGDNLSF